MSFCPSTGFSPQAFLPTKQRLITIGQLCAAFSLMLWYLVQPFMGEYFTLRSHLLLYEYVMGTSDILKTKKGQEKKLERQTERFKKLPESKQHLLIKDYQEIQTYAMRPPSQKVQEGVQILIKNIPPFEQAWIFFSIIIGILILLKKKEAKQAAWLLPLIVLTYCIDNQVTGKPSFLAPDLQLFPTEEKIIHHYLIEPLSPSFFRQKEQLEKGWQRYLIENWSTNQFDGENNRLEEAEFQFTVARLNLWHGQPLSKWLHRFHEKLNPIFLFFILVWNTLFAWIVSRSREK